MAEIIQNNCNVSNLLPLEVICNPTNASSPEAQDGSIQLFINGGTAPYTVSWTNGAQGTYIGNLQEGCYTATVTDYYGDFTKTITCCIENDTFYIDKFIKCADNFNPNIYVFYDGTSLSTEKAEEASESIRTWYQGKVDDGFGGRLFEGVVGTPPKSGENWLWWSLYPYLGSMTGGTLSDGTEITSFGLNGESVENSEYDSRWCSNNDNGKCIPNIVSFNLSTTLAGGEIGDIYQRISLGFKLTGTYGENDTRSEGVPFVVTPNMVGENEGVYGNFVGEDKEYICIIVADEADGTVGLYHGKAGNGSPGDPTYLYRFPFRQYGQGWDDQSRVSYSNRFQWDYESYLRVWEDIKDQDGSINGYIYPVDVPGNAGRHAFIQHSVATVEGTTFTESYFEEKYGTEITEVGPQNLNLSALTRTNVYTGFTGTTAYQNLDPSYQNGPGLKNFDWVVDPTVDSFEGGIMGQNIDEFFSGLTLSDEFIYTSPIDGLIDNYVYSFSELSGCYSFDERILWTGETYSALTVTNFYTSCILCQPSSPNLPPQPTLCFSDGSRQYQFNPNGMVDDYFTWENSENSLTLSYNSSMGRWEITPWTNVGLGAMVRSVNESIPTGTFNNLGVTSSVVWTMSEGFCEGVPLSVTANPSNETCQGEGNGEVILLGQGGYQPYQFRIQNVPPYPDYSVTGIFYNIPPDSYLGQIIDASGNTSSVNFAIQQGDTSVDYTVSLSSVVTSNGTGTRTWNYGVSVNPSLPSGIEITFNIELTHTNIERSSGTANFSYLHTIYKNSSLIVPYTTTTPLTNTTNTTCTRSNVEVTTTTFRNIAESVTFNGDDTSLIGYVTQTVTIDGSTANCELPCQMEGTYNTSVQITNLSINGSDCASVTNAFTPVNENISIYDCISQP